ncbi:MULTISPECIES: FAD-binding dehydrogenase [Arthrobacter]|uniref:FAD-binding dehydrogenase n=2 Tax=Arthrobacter TaxID=1663 RepID=A0ABU9KNC5_9MICC|nr:FAD-binding dehydrogenase [Arthrobacter sp. YJM1]MDP5228308.1 FAD-binding dehydrogenase [Arthrobacter sp. YJM1]
MDADVIVVGHGLSGLVAARELVRAGKRVIIVDQQGPQDLGGQAWWSFGGLFLVDSPEQRRLRVKDSFDLAWRDWQGSAGWDRLDGPGDQDAWAERWGRAYVEFATAEKHVWLKTVGIELTPVVGWAERGDGLVGGHGNSVPRFHVAWGTGTGVVKPFADAALAASDAGSLGFRHRHAVRGLLTEAGVVVGVHGDVLNDDDRPRGAATRHEAVGTFELRAQAVVLASGGIGGNHEMVRRFWPARLGTPPREMLSGVPAYVDGSMLAPAEAAGARLVNRDRMWHYTEGIRNWAPVWPQHGIRILPGPSPLWLDALGRRLPVPGLPGHDTLGTLKILRATPELVEHDHSWFIVSRAVLAKEFALSGSEQNPDITGRDRLAVLSSRLGGGVPGPVQAFVDHGPDFVSADSVAALVRGMNRLAPGAELDERTVLEAIRLRDAEFRNPFSKDPQAQSVHNARRYLGDRFMRVARPHEFLDESGHPAKGLVAVKLHVLTRKSLGGLQTDLASRALDADGHPVPGLYAVGEAAGFGGGGVHGYKALEGTFLGGCIFTGLKAGRDLAGRL